MRRIEKVIIGSSQLKFSYAVDLFRRLLHCAALQIYSRHLWQAQSDYSSLEIAVKNPSVGHLTDSVT